MDKETVEKIFELGADALYKTIDPNSGNVCKQSYSMLKDEAVELFAIPDVRLSLPDSVYIPSDEPEIRGDFILINEPNWMIEHIKKWMSKIEAKRNEA